MTLNLNWWRFEMDFYDALLLKTSVTRTLYKASIYLQENYSIFNIVWGKVKVKTCLTLVAAVSNACYHWQVKYSRKRVSERVCCLITSYENRMMTSARNLSTNWKMKRKSCDWMAKKNHRRYVAIIIMDKVRAIGDYLHIFHSSTQLYVHCSTSVWICIETHLDN